MTIFIQIFNTYKKIGFILGFWATLRILILPFKKINMLVPESGHIIDIGCGSGAFSYYLSLKSDLRKITGIDLSEKRIKIAKKIQPLRENLQFILGDINKLKINSADCYLIIDVLHHIPYQKQLDILQNISSRMKENSKLIIKEVDNSNTVPFLFGHLWEKVLYPTEALYVRSKTDWLKIIKKLGFKCKIYGGVPHFPDSTIIFEIQKIK